MDINVTGIALILFGAPTAAVLIIAFVRRGKAEKLTLTLIDKEQPK